MRAILTVIGKDTVGIIASVSHILAKLNINILDINQTVLQEYFTMIMLVDYKASSVSFEQIKTELNNVGDEIGMVIRIQREEIFDSMHKL
jgi:ACT domain-containing protein